MYITVEISYYPLQSDYDKPIFELLDLLKDKPEVTIQTGIMSTLISGEYDTVMALISGSMKLLMENYPSVFNLKIANACQVKKQ
ncbi:hypothetical protein ACUNWD_05730 [Sunxiuqinia sp. A32]|uniref:hypothetical protein n=1 Tax=Sunxiuqinia sp. A32 TaxID=3461496 RepID=UPI00404578EE